MIPESIESANDGQPARLKRHVAAAVWRRWSPLLSMAVGLFGVWRMQTHYEQVRFAMVALAVSIAVWLVERFARHIQVVNRLTTQWIFQSTAWFLLPFYLRSATISFGHGVSVAGLAVLAVVWTWDPWYARVEKNRALRAALRSLMLFYALNMALPTMFGISLRGTWWLACGVSGGAFAAMGFELSWPGWRHRALAIPLLVFFAWGWQPLFPPVPMRLLKAVWEPANPKAHGQLTLHTTIFAPQGLREELIHRWRHGVRITDRIPLTVQGGRKGGFQTRSRKQNWPADRAGAWYVDVITADGRLLGRAGFRVP